MALPADYRLVAVNSTGVQIDASLITVDIKPFSGDGSGGVSHGAEQSGSNSSSIPVGSSQVLLTVNGSTNIGLNGNVNANLSTNGSTPSGDVDVFIERSTDGGTSWERDPTPVYTEKFTSKRDDSEAITA
jgi:hypothetical protein